MSGSSSAVAQKSKAGRALLHFALLFISWVGAWLLYLKLKEQGVLADTSLAHFLYWTGMRILLWVIPAIVFIRKSGSTLRDRLALHRVKPILLWGGGVGLLIGLVSFITRTVLGQPFLHLVMDWPLLTLVIAAPVVEEIAFRGAVMGLLETRFRFAFSNFLSGFLFLLMHFPGWYFAGVLASKLRNPVDGALPVLLLGWVFGWVTHRSKSLAGGILAHVLNNFFSM